MPSVGILLCNLGTPDAPTPAAVRRYLAQFLSDRRVVELPALLWRPVLHGVVLPRRVRAAAARYSGVWLAEGSPLAVYTARQAAALEGWLAGDGHRVAVRAAMRYGKPSIAQGLDALAAQGVRRVLVLPAYPQYSGTTTASVSDAVRAWCGRQRHLPELRFVNGYHDDALYIAALAAQVEAHWQAAGRGELLVMSFHGLPARTVARGDPYQRQALETGALLAAELGLAPHEYVVTFQSRFGRGRWLEPATLATLVGRAGAGLRRADVICPGFASDCLETLEEIDQEARRAFLAAGGEAFHYIPCLNDSPAGVAALAGIARRHMGGWETLRG